MKIRLLLFTLLLHLTGFGQRSLVEEETNTIEYKSDYDTLMVLSINEWATLIDLKDFDNDKRTIEIHYNDSIRIEFYLYPTDDFNDIRYSVIINEGVLRIENHDTLNGTIIPHEVSLLKLTVAQIQKIETLVKEEKYMKEEMVLITEDTWGGKLIVNNNTMFESTCFTYESLKGKENLLTYILSLLPVKLELYGFS